MMNGGPSSDDALMVLSGLGRSFLNLYFWFADKRYKKRFDVLARS